MPSDACTKNRPSAGSSTSRSPMLSVPTLVPTLVKRQTPEDSVFKILETPVETNFCGQLEQYCFFHFFGTCYQLFLLYQLLTKLQAFGKPHGPSQGEGIRATVAPWREGKQGARAGRDGGSRGQHGRARRSAERNSGWEPARGPRQVPCLAGACARACSHACAWHGTCTRGTHVWAQGTMVHACIQWGPFHV